VERRSAKGPIDGVEHHGGWRGGEAHLPDEEFESGGELAPLGGPKLAECADQLELSHRLRSTQQGTAGSRESELDTSGVVDGVGAYYQASLDQTADHRAHGALMRMRPLGQLVQRGSGPSAELLQHEQLCTAQPERPFGPARGKTDRSKDSAEGVHSAGDRDVGG
jgi:hypothetical protein